MWRLSSTAFHFFKRKKIYMSVKEIAYITGSMTVFAPIKKTKKPKTKLKAYFQAHCCRPSCWLPHFAFIAICVFIF